MTEARQEEGFVRELAGKGSLDDDVLPEGGEPVEQEAEPDGGGRGGDPQAEGLQTARRLRREPGEGA